MPSSDSLDDGRKSALMYDSEKENIRGVIHIPTVNSSISQSNQSILNLRGLTQQLCEFANKVRKALTWETDSTDDKSAQQKPEPFATQSSL